MISSKDFEKKQIVFVFFNEGEKMCFSNDNFVIKDKEEKIKFQTTCYRLFAVYAVGNFSITSVLIQNCKKYGINIIIMTQGFRLITTIGYQKEGNTLLKQKQYEYKSLDIAKQITTNKLLNQMYLLKETRDNTERLQNILEIIGNYIVELQETIDIYGIMAYEGNASRLFFSYYFQNFNWKGRRPRTRYDYINSTLDIGYTLLFNFVESIVGCFGFDLYVGFLHRQFYMRKSLICDLVEPFRCLIDKTVRKCVNLKRFKKEDFNESNGEFLLSIENRAKYVESFMEVIISHKDDIFIYVKECYRSFMKGVEANNFPVYLAELKESQ